MAALDPCDELDKEPPALGDCVAGFAAAAGDGAGADTVADPDLRAAVGAEALDPIAGMDEMLLICIGSPLCWPDLP